MKVKELLRYYAKNTERHEVRIWDGKEIDCRIKPEWYFNDVGDIVAEIPEELLDREVWCFNYSGYLSVCIMTPSHYAQMLQRKKDRTKKKEESFAQMDISEILNERGSR